MKSDKAIYHQSCARMPQMRRWGMVLLTVGVLMALVALARPFPFRVGLNGHEASAWVVLAMCSALLVAVGAGMRLRRRSSR